MRRKTLGLCLVCGDNAIGINFGVSTCMACKAFFRRNGVKLGKVDFVCQHDGDCPVTHTHRRFCNCCRLAKCFRVGMQKSMIWSDTEKLARKEMVQQNRGKRIESEITTRALTIRPSNLLRSAQSQLKCLSLSDQTFLTNIFSAYERTCIVTRNNHGYYFPSKPHTSLHAFLNEYSVRHESLIDYLKIIPEFKRISINDKIRSVQNHFGTMLTLNESINQANRNDNLVSTLNNIFGMELAKGQLRCIQLVQVYGQDPILLKLVLIIESLSSGITLYQDDLDMNRIYDDTKAIFASQNVYVELLWRYILSRLPSEQDAVKFLNKFILALLVLADSYVVSESFVYCFPDEIDKMEPLLQSVWPRSNN